MLYHGSNTFITNKLIPHKSFHYKSYVYATSDFYYALVRAGKFNSEELSFKEDYDGFLFTLVELKPNAFEEVFNTDGYIYIVDEDLFYHNEDFMKNEYASEVSCDIKSTIYIPNVKNEILMRFPHINIIKYEESYDYWNTVNGGKKGYLQRRKERIEKLKSILN